MLKSFLYSIIILLIYCYPVNAQEYDARACNHSTGECYDAEVNLNDQVVIINLSDTDFTELELDNDYPEDLTAYDENKKIAINKDDYSEEIFEDFGLNKDELNLKVAKSTEVGDIYTLGEKYSKALGLTYKDENGDEKNVYMGSYGIGISRLMGTIVEVFNDEKGIIWPKSVAPFDVHLINLDQDGEALKIYNALTENGVEVLMDDREVRTGEKFADSDLIGIPIRVVVSPKSLEAGGVEVKRRNETESCIISAQVLMEFIEE